MPAGQAGPGMNDPSYPARRVRFAVPKALGRLLIGRRRPPSPRLDWDARKVVTELTTRTRLGLKRDLDRTLLRIPRGVDLDTVSLYLHIALGETVRRRLGADPTSSELAQLAAPIAAEWRRLAEASSVGRLDVLFQGSLRSADPGDKGTWQGVRERSIALGLISTYGTQDGWAATRAISRYLDARQ